MSKENFIDLTLILGYFKGKGRNSVPGRIQSLTRSRSENKLSTKNDLDLEDNTLDIPNNSTDSPKISRKRPSFKHRSSFQPKPVFKHADSTNSEDGLANKSPPSKGESLQPGTPVKTLKGNVKDWETEGKAQNLRVLQLKSKSSNLSPGMVRSTKVHITVDNKDSRKGSFRKVKSLSSVTREKKNVALSVEGNSDDTNNNITTVVQPPSINVVESPDSVGRSQQDLKTSSIKIGSVGEVDPFSPENVQRYRKLHDQTLSTTP